MADSANVFECGEYNFQLSAKDQLYYSHCDIWVACDSCKNNLLPYFYVSCLPYELVVTICVVMESGKKLLVNERETLLHMDSSGGTVKFLSSSSCSSPKTSILVFRHPFVMFFPISSL